MEHKKLCNHVEMDVFCVLISEKLFLLPNSNPKDKLNILFALKKRHRKYLGLTFKETAWKGSNVLLAQ